MPENESPFSLLPQVGLHPLDRLPSAFLCIYIFGLYLVPNLRFLCLSYAHNKLI